MDPPESQGLYSPGGEPPPSRLGRGSLRRWAGTFHTRELAMVHSVATRAQGPLSQRSAVLISRSGNGWLYSIILCVVFWHLGFGAVPVGLVAMLNAATIHLFFPKLKRAVGRARPFQSDVTLRSLFSPLDQHSFPSGHTMTLTATLIPVIYTSPGLGVLGAGTITAMCWARVASAHHYVSDVVFGVILGSVVGYPITVLMLRQT